MEAAFPRESYAPESTAKLVISNKARGLWTISIQAPLDGMVDVVVRVGKNGLHDVVLLDDRKRVVAEGLWASRSTKRITSTVCGERTLMLRITRKGNVGLARVVTRAP